MGPSRRPRSAPRKKIDIDGTLSFSAAPAPMAKPEPFFAGKTYHYGAAPVLNKRSSAAARVRAMELRLELALHPPTPLPPKKSSSSSSCVIPEAGAEASTTAQDRDVATIRRRRLGLPLAGWSLAGAGLAAVVPEAASEANSANQDPFSEAVVANRLAQSPLPRGSPTREMFEAGDVTRARREVLPSPAVPSAPPPPAPSSTSAPPLHQPRQPSHDDAR
ncbi:hypothetical protein E2562_017738 [Oryza meyeriana var. granulata]|uniref:Uncharacterized protein n=1 Tax=Oryza meyeriana var. granulata TaxID=110450 RepID=A0A6G1BWS5_9ORYZ|nr:hypothetical protein E2562_017738 [Oryza meyeriana var. granulata]